MFCKLFNPSKHAASVVYYEIGAFHAAAKEMSDKIYQKQIEKEDGYFKRYVVANSQNTCAVSMHIDLEVIFTISYENKTHEVDFDTAIDALGDLGARNLFIMHLPKRDRRKAEKALNIVQTIG